MKEPWIVSEDESIIYNIDEEIKEFNPRNQSALFWNSQLDESD